MDYGTLRIIHITGIVMTFMGLSGIMALKLGGGSTPLRTRLVFHLSHGLGLLTIIVTGFMLANLLGYHGATPWLTGKLVIWLLAGGSMVLANRFFRFAPWIVLFFIALVATAAYLAIYKP
jgi:uncharacterized membrane protein SirB2